MDPVSVYGESSLLEIDDAANGDGVQGGVPGDGADTGSAGPPTAVDEVPAAQGADARRAGDALESDPAASERVVIYVHVVGQVRRPGVVAVPGNARGIDAVTAAGGLRKRADVTGVNLAQPLVDGQQLVIPRRSAGADTGEVGSQPTADPGAGGSVAAPDGASQRLGADQAGQAGGAESSQQQPGADSAPAQPGTDVVDINSATSAQLQTLPGIGPALADRILAWRDASGPCRSPDSLLEVSGIGPARLAALRDLVRC